MKAFALFATTADVGIEAWGRDHRQLLRNAVRGLNALLFGEPPPSRGRTEGRRFRYRGDSWENVLVNLLTEALDQTYSRQRRIAALRIRRAAKCSLDVELRLAPWPCRPRAEVKSATYHGLKIIRRPGGLKYVKIVLDV